VTNQQYRYCVEAQRCQTPAELPTKGPSFASGNLDLPVVWVTAYDAADFCAWIGRRLPTVAEWRRIAYGSSTALYPWGDAPPRQHQVNAVIDGKFPSGLAPAESSEFKDGDAKNGAEQLLGNATEWTSSVMIEKQGAVQILHWNGFDRVRSLAIIGGAWDEEVIRSGSALEGTDANRGADDIGLRCVQSD
jgi:formylglycine-generating enzyme required for sulfatase activity